MVNTGWIAKGIDIDAADVATCTARGLDAVEFNLTAGLPACLGLFDLVILADVIEHPPDPLHVLRSIRSLLNPESKIVVSVPNVGTGTATLWSISIRNSWNIGSHTPSFFTRRTFMSLMTDSDFRINHITASAAPLELIWPAMAKTIFGRIVLALNDRLPNLWNGGFAYQFIMVASPNTDPCRSATTSRID